jgi:hypothetical protein
MEQPLHAGEKNRARDSKRPSAAAACTHRMEETGVRMITAVRLSALRCAAGDAPLPAGSLRELMAHNRGCGVHTPGSLSNQMQQLARRRVQREQLQK